MSISSRIDAVLLDVDDGLLLQFVIVDEFGGFFVDQDAPRFLDLQLALFLAVAADTGKHRFDLLRHLFHAGRRHDFHLRAGFGQFDFDFLLVQRAFAQALAKHLARGIAALHFAFMRRRAAEAEIARRRHQDIDDPLFRRIFSLGAHLAHARFAGLLDADVDQVADDGVDIAADVADFGEFGGFDLDERRIRQFRQAARDLGLADSGRTDHQDVFRRDFVA